MSDKPLRLWPGVLAAVPLALVVFVLPIVMPDNAGLGLMGGMAGGLVVVLWWVLFSRARWYERVGAVGLIALAAFATKFVVHPSIAGGAMGMLTYVLTFPTLTLALVGWAAVSRHLPAGPRLVAVVAALLLGSAPWLVIRTGGLNAVGASDFHWRWTKTPEERLLARSDEEPKSVPPAPATEIRKEPAAPKADELPESSSPRGAAASIPSAPSVATRSEPAAPTVVREPEWAGFRGPRRDGVVPGVRIETDWSKSPPVQMWRRPIGPGWSSFAVAGDFLYTQEQRGDVEVVSCYRVSTGEPVWRHRDHVRFWESNAGAGPRGTPTLSVGRVYTFGGTGVLNALDAATGAPAWSRNVAADLHATAPMWGFSSSPLVVDDVVIVAAGGKLAAYNTANGPRWSGPGSGFSYSSPHLVTIDGVPQVLFMSGPGTVSVAPGTGTILWEHAWQGGAIVQPAVIGDGDIVVNAVSDMGAIGTRRLAIAHGPTGWTVKERWTSIGLKPYFNDFVVHKGHAFGFDGNILACIDLEDGTRKWKGGRYGNGQLVLLPDEDLLVVLSEEGELALVNATPDRFTEVARFKAIDGKTWNHPVLVRDVLLVRNDQEMAAFRLSPPAR